MKFTISNTRIYGSNSYFQHQALNNLEQIAIPQFPNKEVITKLFIGDIPQQVESAYRTSMITGNLAIKNLVKATKAVASEQSENNPQPRPEPTYQFPRNNYKTFTTISIERDVEINDSILRIDCPIWLNLEVCVDMDSEENKNTKSFLDLVTTSLSIKIGQEFFENRIRDMVIFSSQGREPFSLPQFSISANIATIHQNPIDTDLIILSLKSIRQLPNETQNCISKICGLYAHILTEKDEFNRFILAYSALEILIHKINSGLPPAKQGKSGLDKKFRALAVVLSLEGYNLDITTFDRVHQYRNLLLHQGSGDLSVPPAGDTVTLLRKYLIHDLGMTS